MKKIFIVALFAPTLLWGQTPAAGPYIEVSGEAEMTVKPDLIHYNVNYFDYSQIENGDVAPFPTGGGDMPVSVETAEKILLDLAKKQNVKTEKITTDKFTVTAESNYAPGQLNYTFVFNDFGALERFATELRKEKIFAANITLLKYSKEDEVNRELRRKALANAKAKAEEMAAVYGLKLGPALNIWDELGAQPQMPMYYYGEGGEYAGSIPVIGTDPTQSSVNCKVRVRFALQ